MTSDEKLISGYLQNHTDEAIDLIENLDESELSIFIESIPFDLSLLLISHMDKMKVAKIIRELDITKSSELIAKLPFHISQLILRFLDNDLRETLLEKIPKRLSKTLKQTLRYEQHKVGAFINPLAFVIKEEYTIGQVLKKIKKEKPVLYSHLFVINQNHLLVGVVDIKILLTTKEEIKVQDVMKKPHSIKANFDIVRITLDFNWDSSYNILPVVNTEGVFLGTITEDIITKSTQKPDGKNKELSQIGEALGELYTIGLSGVFSGIMSINNDTTKIK